MIIKNKEIAAKRILVAEKVDEDEQSKFSLEKAPQYS